MVTYDRNYVSNQLLRDKGIKVIEIKGSELVRGRGGPRCMSQPLFRIYNVFVKQFIDKTLVIWLASFILKTFH